MGRRRTDSAVSRDRHSRERTSPRRLVSRGGNPGDPSWIPARASLGRNDDDVLQQHQRWMLNECAELLKELGPNGAVNDAMIAA